MAISAQEIKRKLPALEQAAASAVEGEKMAAVLVPIYIEKGEIVTVMTRRRQSLSLHGGEISFPGGRPDPTDTGLVDTALRESEEEIGLAPSSVELVGALPPTSTFVTNFRVFPFVGLISAGLKFQPNPNEVEEVLEFSLDQLISGHSRQRLLRRGGLLKTDTYTVADNLVWGATARILASLLGYLGGNR